MCGCIGWHELDYLCQPFYRQWKTAIICLLYSSMEHEVYYYPESWMVSAPETNFGKSDRLSGCLKCWAPYLIPVVWLCRWCEIYKRVFTSVHHFLAHLNSYILYFIFTTNKALLFVIRFLLFHIWIYSPENMGISIHNGCYAAIRWNVFSQYNMTDIRLRLM